mgnify:CR=1 FL=1
MKLIIHADDFGLSKGITNNILDSFDNGILSSTSVFANGYAFDYAINEYKKRSHFRLSIHINLVEGKPLLPADKVYMLINREGEFCHSFPFLWLKYISGNQKIKQTLKHQVKLEISAQINKVKECFDRDFKINIDSHLHYHLIPFVFETLLELNEGFKFSYIRLPREQFFFPDAGKYLKNYFGVNLIKYFLLNSLSNKYMQCLSTSKLSYCDYFVGVLFAGNMSEYVVKSALLRIMLANGEKNIIEVLFHPGGASKDEELFWKNRKVLKNYYFSEWRKKERETIKSPSFKVFIEDLQKRYENLACYR